MIIWELWAQTLWEYSKLHSLPHGNELPCCKKPKQPHGGTTWRRTEQIMQKVPNIWPKSKYSTYHPCPWHSSYCRYGNRHMRILTFNIVAQQTCKAEMSYHHWIHRIVKCDGAVLSHWFWSRLFWRNWYMK